MQIDFKKDFDFIRDLRSNKLGAPNHFSIKLGKLIQRAREEKGINLDEFAKKINRSSETISEIESGKIDLRLSTLLLFAIEFNKPLTYFFDQTIFNYLLFDFADDDHILDKIINDMGEDDDLSFSILMKF